MKSIISILSALAISTAFTAFADEKKPGEGDKPKHNPEEIFKKLDANSDVSLSMDEFKAGPMGKKDPAKAEEIFKKLDKNSDGKLSLEEWKAREHHAKGGEKPAEKK